MAQDDDGHTALHCAAGYGRNDVLANLLDSLADGKTQSGIDGHRGQRQQFLDMEDKAQQTALHFAARRGHREAASTLLEAGAKLIPLNKDKRTPLHFAAGCGSKEVVHLFLSRMARCNDEECKLQKCRLEDCKVKLCNLPDSQGWTPLHFAAAGKDTEERLAVVEMLVKNGAKKNAEDNQKRMPYWYIDGSSRLVEALYPFPSKT
ncbi:ankyrin repeat-containing domain protein [Hyaloscypha finlandica]|nr:ankyrin repeat-containing domain protein [Hyaloscypha finlandica]